MSIYTLDPYTWALKQAELLRRRSANEIDWDNIAEEIESVGRSEARELESRLIVLLVHLWKWQAQPTRRGASWELTIREQRVSLAAHLRRNPGLRPTLSEVLADAWAVARLRAARETRRALAAVPEACPFALDATLDAAFWPEAEGA